MMESESEATCSASASVLPRLVDHTYTDYSTYIKEGGALEKHKKSECNFPARLHAMLSDEQYSHIISWMPHGRSWRVQNTDRFIKEVIPKYFGSTQYASFTRQLSGWGFKRLHKKGPDFGSYYHECFLQKHPQLTVLMRRTTPGAGRATPNIEEEPDFYLISKKCPLYTDTGTGTTGVYVYSPKFDIEGKKEASVDTKTESSAQEVMNVDPLPFSLSSHHHRHHSHSNFDSLVMAATSRCDTSVNLFHVRKGNHNQYLGKTPFQDESGYGYGGYTQAESHYYDHDHNLGIGNNLHHHSKNVQTQCQVLAQASAKQVLPDSSSNKEERNTLHASTAKLPPTPDVITNNQAFLTKTPTRESNNDNLQVQNAIDFEDFNSVFNDNCDVDGILGKDDWSEMIKTPSPTKHNNVTPKEANHTPLGPMIPIQAGKFGGDDSIEEKKLYHTPKWIQPRLTQLSHPLKQQQKGNGNNDVTMVSLRDAYNSEIRRPAVNSNFFEHYRCVSHERSNRTEGQPSPIITMHSQEQESSVSNGPISRRFQSSSLMPHSLYQSTTPTLPRQNQKLVAVLVPPGKLGIVLSNNDNTGAGAGGVSSMSTRICAIESISFLAGKVQVGDELIKIDGVDVSRLHSSRITSMIASKSDFERVLEFKSLQSNNNTQAQEWI